MAFPFRRRSANKDFQDSGHGGHLGFLIGIILAILYLQVTLMLPTKFRVNWPFGSRQEEKNIVFPMLPTKFQDNWPFDSRGKAKIDFQESGYGGHPVSQI